MARLFLYEFESKFLIYSIGDAAYIEDMVVWFSVFDFPGVEKARKRLFNTYYDPPYVKLRESSTKILGTWDNHDYGDEWGFFHTGFLRKLF